MNLGARRLSFRFVIPPPGSSRPIYVREDDARLFRRGIRVRRLEQVFEAVQLLLAERKQKRVSGEREARRAGAFRD